MFNNSVGKPFIIAGIMFCLIGGGILCYVCPLEGGILSEWDFVQGDFVRFPCQEVGEICFLLLNF